MTRPPRHVVQLSIAVLLALCFVGAAPRAAEAQAWYDGVIQYSTITNCASIIQGFPYQERGAGTYVGFYANPNAGQPAPNAVYYIHVVVWGLGNSCSGMRAYVDVALPASTSLAIDAGHPVYCFADGAPTTPAECPQSLPASSWNPGAYAILSTDAAHANLWPVPQGHNWEFQVPVRSSTTLSNSTLQANVWMIDGNSSPWLRPQQGVYVFSSLPTIIYPSPSTTGITATTAHSVAYLYTYGTTGTGYFDLGTTTSYGLIQDPVAISTPGTAWQVWDDWGPPALTPDTLYHWRVRFQATSGTWYYGSDQTFRTLPDGRVTVGTGTPASCTEAAFVSALTAAGTKEIVFDCGSAPASITMTASRSITTTLTINGGNKVTLLRQAGGAGNHFNVQSAAQLTLAQITLSNAVNTATCGGAVNVAANGRLTLNEARLVGNTSSYQGGAVCNSGTTTATGSLFSDNVSFSHGGAIGNYGSLTLTNCRFVNNRSNANGGAIDLVGTATVTGSSFIGNTAAWRGGGINAYVSTLTVSTSAFLNNSAGMYGGGVSNDASTGSVTGSTFWGNVAGSGGGLEVGGTSGGLVVTNSTVTGNRATTQGGGLYWVPGSTVGLTLLNATVADNTAGTAGGSIYAGAAGVFTDYVMATNTIVSAGSPANCSATVWSRGNNLEDANSCGFSAASDKRNTNPNIGPLQDNGGTTKTRAPMPGSAAIDAGTNTGAPATDQRGSARLVDGDGNGSAVCDIGAVEASYAALSTPSGLSATATSASQVALSWGAVAGATSYEVWRSSLNGSFALAYTVAAASASDTGLSADTTYLYKVRAVGLAGSSAFSAVDAATTTVFTDASLAGATIKAAHITELRTAVNAMRAAAGLPAAVFTDATITARGTMVKRAHLVELRAALDAARALVGLGALAYTDATITQRVTPVKAVHIMQLRAGVQ